MSQVEALLEVKRQSIAKTILIVEDNPAMGSYLVEAILQETAYHPLLVGEGRRALEVVKQIRPNLFLLDYHLAGMNGIELYDHLHTTPGLEAIPAVMVSASLPRHVLETEIKQRNLPVINGPHELDDLLRMLHQCLDSTSTRV